jgi:hypothetical protein
MVYRYIALAAAQTRGGLIVIDFGVTVVDVTKVFNNVCLSDIKVPPIKDPEGS